jgi:hypothetical protein
LSDCRTAPASPRYANDLAARVIAWNAATSVAQQLADEFGEWVEKPDLGRVQAL